MAWETYLELMLASLRRWGGVEKIDCENLSRQHHVSICHLKIHHPSSFPSANHLQVLPLPHSNPASFHSIFLLVMAGRVPVCPRPHRHLAIQNPSSRGEVFLTMIAIYDRDRDFWIWILGLTDGSFVNCRSLRDVESECQSLSMIVAGRSKEVEYEIILP